MGRSDRAVGYLLGAVAAAAYGTNPLLAVPLYRDGMSPDSVLFFRYLLAVPLVAAMIGVRAWRKRRHPDGASAVAAERAFVVPARRLLPLVALGLTMAVSSLTLFMSYNYMPVGIASTMLFVYPVMVALLMSLCFGERLRAATVVCLVLALSGIALLYRGGEGGAGVSLVGTGLVMLSSLSYAVYIVGTSQTPVRTIPALKVSLYVLASGFVLFAVRLAWRGQLEVPAAGHWWLWADMLALAVFPTLISFLATTAAIQRVGSTATAILGALEPVTAVVLGMTFLGERPTPQVVLGMALILVAVTIVVLGVRLPHALGRLLHPRR